MQRLKDMDEVTAQRCRKCDYLRNEIPVSHKKPNCSEFAECEVYQKTERLKDRIKYIIGECGPIWFCSRKHGCFLDTFED